MYSYPCDRQTASIVCPSDWRLPSNADWKLIADIMGNNPASKLKA
jgi:uncharacterized protein (TIGR02145 family)